MTDTQTDRTAPVRRQEAGSAVSWRRPRSWVTAAHRHARDWLDRPLTSLHLVLAIGALLLGIGLLMVLSSSSVSAFRNGGSSFTVFRNQATYAVLGLIAFYFAMQLPVRGLRSMATPAVMVSLLLLLAVLVPGIGSRVYGARSWIRLGGGLQFQPSEIAKLALAVWMAHVLASRRHEMRSIKAVLIPAAPVFLLMVALIMMQPDLGTTITLAIVFLATLWFAGAPGWLFGTAGLLGAGGAVMLIFTAGYRSARLQGWLDPQAHPQSAYQLLQSLYGLGNGGLFGVGLGHSTAKWSYLPNADSDFIFAIIGEELGLIGAGILILLFVLLGYTGIRIARRNVDPFVKILAASCTVWLVGQAAINIGYVVGLLPVTGIPLPMISTGGTSLLVTLTVFGLLANFARREPQAATALNGFGPGRMARFLGIAARPDSALTAKAATRRASRVKRRKAKDAKKEARRQLRADARQAREDDRRRAELEARRRKAASGRTGPARPASGRAASGTSARRAATGRSAASDPGRRAAAPPDARRRDPDRRPREAPPARTSRAQAPRPRRPAAGDDDHRGHRPVRP